MPEIYDILRHCEESHLTADEKSLLATQLAPHWTNSEEARRALETAVVYTEAEEEAEFWQGLQVSELERERETFLPNQAFFLLSSVYLLPPCGLSFWVLEPAGIFVETVIWEDADCGRLFELLC